MWQRAVDPGGHSHMGSTPFFRTGRLGAFSLLPSPPLPFRVIADTLKVEWQILHSQATAEFVTK